jgi:hypothetical protein
LHLSISISDNNSAIFLLLPTPQTSSFVQIHNFVKWYSCLHSPSFLETFQFFGV